MKNRDVRRQNLKLLIKKAGSQKAFAEKVGLSPSQVSQLITGRREMGESIARRTESAMGLQDGWMDRLHQINEETGEYIFTHDLTLATDWSKFANIFDAVASALSGKGLSTSWLLEISEIFYEIDIDTPPKEGAVTSLYHKIKKSRVEG